MATQEQLTPIQLRKGFDLGEWRIWPNAGQIEKDGVKLHIEPKLVEVLLLLAAVPGQVVTRDELLNHAWERQVVCDDALTRTISELRTLLGDSGRERRYIRTVPKRGYSLIADVFPIAEATTAGVEATVAQAAVADIKSQAQTRAEVQGLANSAAWLPRESFTNRLIKYWLYGVGSLTTVVSAMMLLIFFFAEDVNVEISQDDDWNDMNADTASVNSDLNDLLISPALPPFKRYAVLPFANLTPEEDLGYFTQGLEEDIRTALANLEGSQVAGRLASNQFQPLAQTSEATIIQDIAEQLNVDAILDGTVRLIDGQIRVTVQLLDGKTGFPLWSKRYDKAFDAVLKLQTFISDDVLCELETRLPKMQYVAALDKRERSQEEEMSLPNNEYGHTRHIEWLAR